MNVLAERSRFLKVFGKREVEVLAIDLFDRDLLGSEFTRAEAIRKDPAFLGVEGFDLAVDWNWIREVRLGVYRCSRAFAERARNAAEKDQAEGIPR